MSIFKDLKPKEKEVDLTDFGLDYTVTVKEVPYKIKSLVEDYQSCREAGKATATLLIWSIYHNGERCFKEIKELDDVPTSVLGELFNVAMVLSFSKTTADEIKLLKKN